MNKQIILKGKESIGVNAQAILMKINLSDVINIRYSFTTVNRVWWRASTTRNSGSKSNHFHLNLSFPWLLCLMFVKYYRPSAFIIYRTFFTKYFVTQLDGRLEGWMELGLSIRWFKSVCLLFYTCLFTLFITFVLIFLEYFFLSNRATCRTQIVIKKKHAKRVFALFKKYLVWTLSWEHYWNHISTE